MLTYTTQEAADEACRVLGAMRWLTDGETYYLPETREEFDALAFESGLDITIRDEEVKPA